MESGNFNFIAMASIWQEGSKYFSRVVTVSELPTVGANSCHYILMGFQHLNIQFQQFDKYSFLSLNYSHFFLYYFTNYKKESKNIYY